MEKIIHETILGVRFDIVTMEQAIKKALLLVKSSNQQQFVVTPNPEMVLYAQKDKEFKKILKTACLSLPDGAGILWASAYQNRMKYPGRFKERVTGVDFMKEFIKACSYKKIRIFLLGAALGVAESVKKYFEHTYPGVTIVGVSSGSAKNEDFHIIQKAINNTLPEVLFIAFGSPKQEKWIVHNLPSLPSVKLAVGVGGAFDFIAGIKKRAPTWMQKLGLEWLFRLIQEPRRIVRIFNAVIKFPIAVLRNR